MQLKVTGRDQILNNHYSAYNRKYLMSFVEYLMFTCSISLNMSTLRKMVSQNSGIPLGFSSLASSVFSSIAAFFFRSSWKKEWFALDYCSVSSIRSDFSVSGQIILTANAASSSWSLCHSHSSSVGSTSPETTFLL